MAHRQRPAGNGHIRTLHLKLPHALWEALEERRLATGEPIHHIVRAALADHLQIEHHTLYQCRPRRRWSRVSTAAP